MNYFVDTSFWCALYDAKDKNYQKARLLWKNAASLPMKLFISDYIFDEIVTLVRKRMSHSHAVDLAESLLNSKVIIFLEVDQDVREKAWQIFKKYDHKDFSFTDCSSFALMQSCGIKKALAFDQHFEQMDFVVNEL